MIPYNIKGLLLYVLSLNTILTSVVLWLQNLKGGISDVLSILVGIAGLIISYYTIQRLRLDIREKRLINAIKKIELDKLKNE